MGRHARVARFAAPAAFLAAATVAVLLVRSGLDDGGAATPAPVATTTAPETTATVSTTTAPPAATTTGPAEFYVIQSGDTLAVVAERHDTTVEQLLVLNPEVDPVALNIGDRIRVK
jgi:LysM repeat protein